MIVCLDSNIVIYSVEADPKWKQKVDARIQAVVAAGNQLAITDATRFECLVGPKSIADKVLESDYQRFFRSLGMIRIPSH